MLQKEPVEAIFCVRDDSDLVTDSSSYFADWTWTTGSGYYRGQVLITNLDTQAPNDDNATFSCTMTGTGELEWQDQI